MGDFTDSIQQLSTTSTEFKRALKVLIKYEINCLLKRLSDTGEEAIVITTSVEDGAQDHIGTVKGEGFLQATDSVKTLKQQFLHFCTDSSLPQNRDKGSEGPVDFSQKSENTHKHHFEIQDSVSRQTKSRINTAENDGENINSELSDSKQETNRPLDEKRHCLMNGDKLYPLEPRNTESMYFQENELGMVCKKDAVKKMFESTDAYNMEATSEDNSENLASFPCKNGITRAVSDKGQYPENLAFFPCKNGSRTSGSDERQPMFEDGHTMSDDEKCMFLHRHERDIQVSPVERCKKLDKFRERRKLSQYCKSPVNQPNQLSKHPNKDQRILEQLSYADHLERDSLGSTDLTLCKKFGVNQGFDLSIDKKFMSQQDLEYLQQCYFSALRNKYEEKLLDCSIKRENNTDSSLHEESVNMFERDNIMKSPTNTTHSKTFMDYKSNSSHFDSTLDRERYSFSRKYRHPASMETVVSEHYKNGTLDETEIEGAVETDDLTGHYNNGQITDKRLEPCEPINLKIEPEDRFQTPVVKLEPGTDCTSTIEQILSDPNVPNFIAQSHSQGNSPLSASSTMHLNFCCKICGQNFKNRQYRDFHVKLHKSSHQYFCNLCSLGFENEMECKKHQNEHTEPVFQCESCGYRCTREFRMRAHREICGSPSKIFKCPFCHKQFAAQRYMRIHIKSHDAHNIHTCPVCQNTYPLKNSLLKHMKKKHSQDQL